MAANAADPNSWLRLRRTVRFGDTDAAGVMHFHQLLRWCHEAYEESLERFGIPVAEVFPNPGTILAVALPIIHCSADFYRPLSCGDALTIYLRPHRLDVSSYRIVYEFINSGSPPTSEMMAKGLTRHRAIEATRRTRCALPLSIACWLEESAISLTKVSTSDISNG